MSKLACAASHPGYVEFPWALREPHLENVAKEPHSFVMAENKEEVRLHCQELVSEQAANGYAQKDHGAHRHQHNREVSAQDRGFTGPAGDRSTQPWRKARNRIEDSMNPESAQKILPTVDRGEMCGIRAYLVCFLLAAPQGFEPRYAAPEAAVLPLNEGATAVLCQPGGRQTHLVTGLTRHQPTCSS